MICQIQKSPRWRQRPARVSAQIEPNFNGTSETLALAL